MQSMRLEKRLSDSNFGLQNFLCFNQKINNYNRLGLFCYVSKGAELGKVPGI